VVSLIYHGEVHQFEGIVNGEIAREKHGTDGFGYDPVFMPVDKGLTVTFAEMTSEDKNAISHRGRAIEKLAKFFLS
jgi:XTP/dITP diphosphohydrolase